jgi:FAD/FMN-containing dehydrogenase
VPVADTAYAMRGTGFNSLVLSEWLDPAQDDACIRWARDTEAALAPFAGEKRYANYVGDDDADSAEALREVYGPNLSRLRKIKAKYDPANLFRRNVNIPPA